LHGLAETYCLGRYDVNQRTTLHPGKDNFVYSLRELGFGKNHARARAAQRLVRGRSHDLRMRNWRRMRTSRHQPREVGHIHQVESAYLVGNLPHAGEIDNAGIGAASADD